MDKRRSIDAPLQEVAMDKRRSIDAPLQGGAWAQNSVFDLKSATRSSKLKCYHARTDPIGRWGQSS